MRTSDQLSRCFPAAQHQLQNVQFWPILVAASAPDGAYQDLRSGRLCFRFYVIDASPALTAADQRTHKDDQERRETQLGQWGGVEQVQPVRRSCRFAPAGDAELGQDVRHVHARGLGRDEQPGGDLRIGPAVGD